MAVPNLYTHKESNIFRTWLLMSAFLILVIGLGYAFSYYFNNEFILFFAVSFSVISALVSYFSSDKIALAISKAQPVKKGDAPELYNIVENLSITAGLPMPRVFITPEAQINAFATGRNPKNAAIAVTRGALERLNKTELEGVLAHELSHVGNRDILVSTVAVVLAGVLAMLGDFFMRSMLWGDRDNNRSNKGNGAMLLIGLAFSILAPLGAMLLQLAISRKRELLADATGALLTRYPEGLAAALEKIASDPVPMRTAKESTAHLWIDNPFKNKKTSWFHKLFLTHPPIQERIAALRGMQSTS